MDVYKASMSEFLGTTNAVFIVPVYQRNYDWGESQCRRLFQDMCRAAETGQGHFLGTICFKPEGVRKRFIVDGQQRLTSVTLLMKAMRDFDSRASTEIDTTYLKNSGYSVADDEFAQVKLHLNGHDDAIYRLLLSCDRQTIEDRIQSAQRNSGIYRNYILFHELVSGFVSNGGRLLDLMLSMEKLVVVSLVLDSENPQEIFESLNSTGLDLSSVDLLRNSLLMRFPYDVQVEFYEQYWRNIESAVGKESMQAFLMSYLIAKRKHHQIRVDGDDKARTFSAQKLLPVVDDVLGRFSGDGSDYDRMKDMFSDMLRSARLYRDMVFDDDFVLRPDVPAVRRALYFLIAVNKFTAANSLVLYLMRLKDDGKITDGDLEAACIAILSMAFRCRVCRRTGITSQFVTSVILRLEDMNDYSRFIPVFWGALTSGKGLFAFPSDSEFMEALTHGDLYRRLRADGMKYLLYALELCSKWRKGLPDFSDGSVSIEHIMLQTLSYEWKSSLTKDSLERYDQYVHTIGNLALTSYNREMSNKSFEEKRAYYQNANFYYTKQLDGYAGWQVADIEQRGRVLAEAALEAWPLPEEYRTFSESVSSSLHTLSEDAGQFTHFRPMAVLFEDFRMPVKTWADMAVLLAKHLWESNSDVVAFLARSGRAPMLEMQDGDHDYNTDYRYKDAGHGLFVRVHSSTSAKVADMAKMVSEFDGIAGTGYLEGIMFQVK